jgi:outer membrane protein OmpA-like peptidoglycan-associated protein
MPLLAQTPDENLINAASLFSGSYMRSTPPSFVPSNLMGGEIPIYSPEALFDQSPKMWCAKSKQSFPHTFELELTEKFLIQKLDFDNVVENFKGISAKEVRVEFSTSVTNPEYKQAGVFTLKEMSQNSFDIAPSEARIIRISILSNYGNKEFTELTEFKAFGVPVLKDLNTINFDGTWNSNWDNVTFNQTKSLFDGHYVFNQGVIRFGGVNRNQLSYTWIEKVINREGQTIMFMNQEGNRLTGIWCHDNDWAHFGFWILTRPKDFPFEPYVATVAKETYSVNTRVVDEMSNQLQKNKKLIVYGINFLTGSAEILESSKQVLVQIAEVLKASPELKVRIEGHTDHVGTAEYNQSLSQKRAASVMAFFVDAHGIQSGRLTALGKGESTPIAGNETEVGKSANRRVEIHLLE